MASVNEASPPSDATEGKAEAHVAEERLELYQFPQASPAAAAAAVLEESAHDQGAGAGAAVLVKPAAAAVVVAFVLEAVGVVEQLPPGCQAAAVVAVEVPRVECQTAAGHHLEMQQNTCHN